MPVAGRSRLPTNTYGGAVALLVASTFLDAEAGRYNSPGTSILHIWRLFYHPEKVWRCTTITLRHAVCSCSIYCGFDISDYITEYRRYVAYRQLHHPTPC
jgi:hypothetical protein